MSATNAGSLRFPRCGTGARYGASVSSIKVPRGRADTVSLIWVAFLKVAFPVKERMPPRLMICWACVAVPGKQ